MHVESSEMNTVDVTHISISVLGGTGCASGTLLIGRHLSIHAGVGSIGQDIGQVTVLKNDFEHVTIAGSSVVLIPSGANVKVSSRMRLGI